MPVSFGNADDRGGTTIFTPADTGFLNQAVPLNATNSGVAFTGPVVNVSPFDRWVIVSNVGVATACRLSIIVLDENGVALVAVDDPGIITFTLQQGFTIQDGNFPQSIAGCALIKLAVYGLAAIGTCTLRLMGKNRY